MEALDEPARTRWHVVLDIARTPSRPEPPRRFFRALDPLVRAIGEDEFRGRAVGWLRRAARTRPDERWPLVPPDAGDLLRGLAWACARFGDPDTARALADLAAASFRRTPAYGPRSRKVGSACLLALAELPGGAGADHLLRLNSTLTRPSARPSLERAIERVAERLEVPAEEADELLVPDYGLAPGGIRRERVRDRVAELAVTGPATAELTWMEADGERGVRAPAARRGPERESVRELRRTLREVRAMLPAQRARLERLLLTDARWPFDRWRERYLDHGLVGALARRLVWVFETAEGERSGLWLDGRLVDAAGDPLAPIEVDAEVRLWHPVHATAEAVAAWRERVERAEVEQPFRQAHREVYRPEGEESEATTLERYAGRMLRHGQFTALCRQRGWRYVPQPAWGSSDEPTLHLPEHGLRVTLSVEPPPGGPEGNGIYPWVVSGSLRFVDEEGEALALGRVPPAVFSEVVRDVDLFVRVAGFDPGRALVAL